MSATSETKYGLVFRQNGEDYLYIDQIGAGARGIVQLVQNTRTGELVVRKVSHPRLQAPRDTPLAVDLEAAVADYIKSNCPGRGPRINIAELLGHTVVRYPARSTTGNDKISHISYWKYYNLGNLSKFLQSQAGQKTITFALVARFIHQTLTAVALMYSLGIEHGDLHNRNIFLHLEPGSDAPDFYVGDFDHVRVSSSLAEIQHEKVEGCTSDLAALYANIQRLMFFANGLKPARLTEYEDLRSIKKDLGVLHTRFAAKQGSIRPLPQPEDLLALAARAKEVEIRYRAEQPLGLGASPCSTLVRAPKARYYEKQALMSQTFEAVVGPWHIAQIDIKNREILEIEEKTHLHCLAMGWDSDPGAPGNGGGSNEEEDEGDAYDWYMCGLGE
jgi:serine/threonine protein kinase